VADDDRQQPVAAACSKKAAGWLAALSRFVPKPRGKGTKHFVKREMANRCPGYRKPIDGDRLHGQRASSGRTVPVLPDVSIMTASSGAGAASLGFSGWVGTVQGATTPPPTVMGDEAGVGSF
jgi:hypothetical protein